MRSLSEIEAAIEQLPREEAHKLSDWLQEYLDDVWDEQIAADAKAGRLDELIQSAKANIAANHVKSLDEIINNS